MNPDPRTTVPGGVPDLTAAPAPETVRPLGRYELLRELGRGGMGVVYAARDPDLGREVAVKVLSPELAAAPRAVERFLREARLQARVAHERVVPVYDVGQDAVGGPYLVMPLLKGDPLTAFGALPVPELLRVGREIAEGLAAAHAAGLVHRDIKPANVWLEAPRRNVKILDFGLARGGESGDPARTAPGSFAGTPAYMSPEQARGQPVNFRTDLFSLGSVLYQLATGTKPFPQTVLLDLLNAVVNHDPPPLHDRVPDCPPVLSALVARLMAKDPEARPASAQRVAEELRAIERALGAPPVLVLPSAPADPFAQLDTGAEPDRTERELPPAPRATDAPPARRWVWPTAGALAALAVAVLVWLAVRAATLDKPAAQVPDPPKKSDPSKKTGPQLLKPVRALKGPENSGRAVAVAFSPDGTRVAAQLETESGLLLYGWDTHTGAAAFRFGTDKLVDYLAFWPDSAGLLTVDNLYGGVRLWDVTTGTAVADLGRNLTDRFRGGQVTPDSKLTTGGNKGFGFEFDLRNPKGQPKRYDLKWAGGGPLHRSPDGQFFAQSLDGGNGVWVSKGDPTNRTKFVPGAAIHLGAPVPDDGRHIVLVRGDKLLWVNLETGDEVRELTGLKDKVRGGFVVVTPNGKYAAACSTDEYNGAGLWPRGFDPRVRVWDTATGAQVAHTDEYPGTAQALAVSRDSKYVALGGYLKPAEVRVYRLEP